MARRRAGGEGLDDDHAAADTWTCRIVVIGSISIGRFALRLWRNEQFADARDVVGAGGVGQQAVVADAVEPLGQDVDEEWADELVCGKCHLLVSISALDSVVLPLEGDAVFVESARFPPLEVFGRRPSVPAEPFVNGRHPKTFTLAEVNGHPIRPATAPSSFPRLGSESRA